MMDRNMVLLTGTLVSAAERSIGAQGRTLTELRLAVSRPGRKGEGEPREVVPIILWAAEVGAAVRDLPAGTALTVLGRVSAREWTAPGGQTKVFLEIVGESVTVDAAVVPVGEPVAAASRPAARPEARPVERPGGRADEVPF